MTIKTNTNNTTEMTIVTGITTQVVDIPRGDAMSWKLFRGGEPEAVYGVDIQGEEESKCVAFTEEVDQMLGGVNFYLDNLKSLISAHEYSASHTDLRLAERNTVIDGLTAQVDEQQKVINELREDICAEKDTVDKTYLEIASAGFGKRLKYFLTGRM